MKVVGGFNVKLDNEENRMFVMPIDKHQWYIPQYSKFRYRLREGQYTEILLTVYNDGLFALMPKTFVIQEKILDKKKN
jgi:hypothetical protein